MNDLIDLEEIWPFFKNSIGSTITFPHTSYILFFTSLKNKLILNIHYVSDLFSIWAITVSRSTVHSLQATPFLS